MIEWAWAFQIYGPLRLDTICCDGSPAQCISENNETRIEEEEEDNSNGVRRARSSLILLILLLWTLRWWLAVIVFPILAIWFFVLRLIGLMGVLLHAVLELSVLLINLIGRCVKIDLCDVIWVSFCGIPIFKNFLWNLVLELPLFPWFDFERRWTFCDQIVRLSFLEGVFPVIVVATVT